MERGGEERNRKKNKLIFLQTKNAVHAAIAQGFGFESTAANSHSAQPLTFFKLHLRSKPIQIKIHYFGLLFFSCLLLL